MSDETNTMLSESPEAAQPVQSHQRIEFVDIIRGFALLGVFIANMSDFSGQRPGMITWPGFTDRSVAALIDFLVRAKFYSLFSFLFGWGMAVHLERAAAKGAKFLPVYLRRLTILLLIGILHGTFIWRGDILAIYALFGFLLVFFRSRSPRTILTFSILLLAFNIVLNLPAERVSLFRESYQQLIAPLQWDIYPEALYTRGTYWEITLLRFQEFIGGNAYLLYFFGPIFSMFLLGLYTGKRRIFQDIENHIPLVRRVMWICLALGLSLNGLFAASRIWNETNWPAWVNPRYYLTFSLAVRTIGAPVLMLFYVSAIILLNRKPSWQARLAPLASLGQMALTNYLIQSVISTLIFYNYGLGIYEEFGPSFGLVLTLIIYWGQIQFSAWWMDRFQFGPIEWLWRTLTYQRRQPLVHGETYASVPPNILPVWLSSIDPHKVLVGVWGSLIIWAGTLGYFYINLNVVDPQSLLGVQELGDTKPGLTGSVEPEPIVDGQPHEPVVIVTLVVDPVPYLPGPLAASGDLTALAESFNADLALAQIEALTASPHFGRYAGSPQGHDAGDYIAEQFSAFGLQPAGDQRSFFQPFPVDYIRLENTPSLTIITPDGEVTEFKFTQDFSVLNYAYLGEGSIEGQVVWANNCEHDDFDDIETVGKVILCRTQNIPEAGRNAIERGAAALLIISQNIEDRPLDFSIPYQETWVPETIPGLIVSPDVAAQLLKGNGKTIQDLTLQFISFPLDADVRIQVDVANTEDVCPVDGCIARNVLGVIPGRDPKFQDEILIIGAHYDHLGQSPDGSITWYGANDNASGIAVMLEIAHTWLEQGYVPRRTVVFAAWDAEELGLVGSRYYVQNPKYPLDKTVVVLNLDMVGAGEPILNIGGSDYLVDYLQNIALQYSVDTEITQSGGSDHASFLERGVPAGFIIWQFGDPAALQYHRPGDTSDSIDPLKLDLIGKIAGTAALGFTEGEPEILALIEERGRAVLDGDLPAFLNTSTPENVSNDRAWFSDLQNFDPVDFNIQAQEIQVIADTATASVIYKIEYPNPYAYTADNQPETISHSVQIHIRFIKSQLGWKWAGPDLVWSNTIPLVHPETPDSPGSQILVAFPKDKTEDVVGVPEELAAHYQTIATLLGLPPETSAVVLLFPNTNSLRADTAISLPSSTSQWIGANVVKWVFPKAIVEEETQKRIAAQLILAEAGIPGDALPWLWEGLSIEVDAQEYLVGVHQAHLPGLTAAITAKTLPENDHTSWARVQFLRQQLGWSGLGRFITLLGQLCSTGDCRSGTTIDTAFRQTLGVDHQGFETLWQDAWRQKIENAQTAIDAALEQRTTAVLNVDQRAFLTAVDIRVPNLTVEQESWFNDFIQYPIESFSLQGQLIAILEDGSILAKVSLSYQLTELEDRWAAGVSTHIVRLSPWGTNFRWAGEPLEELRGPSITVLYPHGFEELAQGILEQAQSIYLPLANNLGLPRSGRLTLKLYQDHANFRTSVALSLPLVDWLKGWTGKNQSIKLRIQPGLEAADYKEEIIRQATRHLLANQNITEEWFIQGIAAHQATQFGESELQFEAATYLRRITIRNSNQTLIDLDEVGLDYQLEETESAFETAYAWDTIRYIDLVYGNQALKDLIQAFARGQTTEAAFRNSLGLSLEEFHQEWIRSLFIAHSRQYWVDLAASFDVDQALSHIQALTGEELSGRQTGSPGEKLAANYIAQKFAEYGLIPLIELAPTVSDDDIEISESNDQYQELEISPELETNMPGMTYFQEYEIQFTQLITSPQLSLYNQQGELIGAFDYRADYKLVIGPSFKGGFAEGQLVWVTGSYEGLDLTGKIIARIQSTSVQIEMDAAIEAGAAGLILIRETELTRTRDLQEKAALPILFAEDPSIPVILMGPDGYKKIQTITDQSRTELINAPPALLFEFQAVLNVPFSQPQQAASANIIGLLPGANPILKHEYIIIGAHYDHVGDDPDILICNGEQISDPDAFNPETCQRIPGLKYSGFNDNASGIAALLEIAHLFALNDFQPDRSILFVAWGSQETGQVGSRYYLENPVVPLENTAAVMQLDSIGGGKGYYLLSLGSWTREGSMLYGIYAANEIYDSRLTISSNLIIGDQAPFRAVGIPGMHLSWEKATDPLNWPDIEAYPVEPDRLSIAGILAAFTLLSLTH